MENTKTILKYISNNRCINYLPPHFIILNLNLNNDFIVYSNTTIYELLEYILNHYSNKFFIDCKNLIIAFEDQVEATMFMLYISDKFNFKVFSV